MYKNQKIGVMGGTFDPIHMGHLILAQNAMDYFGLEKVLFIPSGTSYMKNKVTDKYIRSDMVKLAIENNPFFSLSTIEMERPGNTYSYETMQTLKESCPENEFYFIVGADSIFHMREWKNIHLLFDNCIIAAAVREGYSTEELHSNIQSFENEFPNCKIELFHTARVDISSTEIRDKIRNGLSARYIIPDKVLSYIEKNHIYEE